MNLGLFAMMAGFLLPLYLVVRLAASLEPERGWYHPLNLVLGVELLAFLVPVAALAPTAWGVMSGRTIEDGASLLEYTASDAGLAKLVVQAVAVIVADLAMPRVWAQLVQEPTADDLPTLRYVLRDLGVLAVCLALAVAAALDR